MSPQICLLFAIALFTAPSFAQDGGDDGPTVEAPEQAPAAATPAPAPAAAPAPAPAPAAAPKKAKPAAKKKGAAKRSKPHKKKPAESRYKSRVLSQSLESTYFYDENGNPARKGKKKSEATSDRSVLPSDAGAADPTSCSAEKPCVDKKSSDADSL